MTSAEVAVELVIQTAVGLLTGRFAPREAVTILASQVPRACGEARRLVEDQPERARGYAEVLVAIRAELTPMVNAGAEGRQARAVLEDLDRLVEALS